MLPRELTHLEFKHYHKLSGISDGYRSSYRTPVAKFKVSTFCLWRRGFVLDIKGKALKSIYALLG